MRRNMRDETQGKKHVCINIREETMRVINMREDTQ